MTPDQMRNTPSDQLSEIERELLFDNERVNRRLAELRTECDRLVVICDYTMLRAIEHFEARTKAAAEKDKV